MMYAPFKLARKYLQYIIGASNGKGHGVHSPFVFDFIRNVLNDREQYDCYTKIEERRKELLADKNEIEVTDHGAGSSVIRTSKRRIDQIASSSLKPKRYAQLLFRVVKHYNCKKVLELGTSFGITTSYLAANNSAVFTLEGSKEIAAIAKITIEKIPANINLVTGAFETTLDTVFEEAGQFDLAFIDGNHRYEPTLQYFHKLKNRLSENGILVFDDIHWSEGMERAWEEIKADPGVMLTIDLFFIGIVFYNPNFKVKQHFSIRF